MGLGKDNFEGRIDIKEEKADAFSRAVTLIATIKTLEHDTTFVGDKQKKSDTMMKALSKEVYSAFTIHNAVEYGNNTQKDLLLEKIAGLKDNLSTLEKNVYVAEKINTLVKVCVTMKETVTKMKEYNNPEKNKEIITALEQVKEKTAKLADIVIEKKLEEKSDVFAKNTEIEDMPQAVSIEEKETTVITPIDPEQLYTSGFGKQCYDFFALRISITGESVQDASATDQATGILLTMFDKHDANLRLTPYFNRHSGKKYSYSTFDAQEYKNTQRNKTQELYKQTHNWLVWKNALALAQYTKLRQTGYTSDEIMFDPDYARSYPKDYKTQQEKSKAYTQEMETKILSVREKAPYKKALQKYQAYTREYTTAIDTTPRYKNKEKIFAQDKASYDTAIQKQQAKEKELLPTIIKDWEIERNKSNNPKITSLNPYQAITTFHSLSDTIKTKQPGYEKEIGTYFELADSLQKSNIFQKVGEIMEPIINLEPAITENLQKVAKKISKNNIPTAKDAHDMKQYEQELKNNLAGYSGNVAPDHRYTAYIKDKDLQKINMIGDLANTNYYPKTLRVFEYQQSAGKDEMNVEVANMAQNGPFGKIAYTALGVWYGFGGAVLKGITAPVGIYQSLDLLFTADPYTKQQKRDTNADSIYGKRVDALTPPETMQNFWEPENPDIKDEKESEDKKESEHYDVALRNIPFLFTLTLTNIYMLSRGGILLSPSVSSSLKACGIAEKTVDTISGTITLFGTTSWLHAEQYMQTADQAGMTGTNALMYTLFQLTLATAIEQIGGFTVSGATKEGGEAMIKRIVEMSLTTEGKIMLKHIGIEAGEENLNELLSNALHLWLNVGKKYNFIISDTKKFIELNFLTIAAMGAKAGHTTLDVYTARDLFLKYPEGKVQLSLLYTAMKLNADASAEEIKTNLGNIVDPTLAGIFVDLMQALQAQEDTETNPDIQAIEQDLANDNQAERERKIANSKKPPTEKAEDFKKKFPTYTGTTEQLATLIHAMHEVGTGEKGKDGKEAGIYNYTIAQLGAKMRMGTEEGLTIQQAKWLLQEGYCGELKQTREYQQEAISEMMKLAGRWLDTTDMSQNEKSTLNEDLRQEFLLEMATGSGKTYTFASLINTLSAAKKALKEKNPEKYRDLPPFKILVLSHKIGIVEQHAKEFFAGKNPLMQGGLLNAKRTIYHSKTKFNKDTGEEELTGEVEIETMGQGEDEIIFAVDITALKGLDGFAPNIIVADEAHHGDTHKKRYRQAVLLFSNKRDSRGIRPLVINMTATPTPELSARCPNGYKFGLGEWLAHEDSPELEYYAVAFAALTPAKQQEINTKISNLSQISDSKIRKEKIKELRDMLKAIENNFADTQKLVDDMVDRFDGDFSKTVIFAIDIPQAKLIAKLINEHKNTKPGIIAGAMHSESKDPKEVLRKYEEQSLHCLVAVDMLNEGIDLPNTKRGVFAYGTNSATKFQQQLGRGLRGDDVVQFFDYGGSLTNLSYINSMNAEMNDAHKREQTKNPNHIRKQKQIKIFDTDKNTHQTHDEQQQTTMMQITYLKDVLTMAEVNDRNKAKQLFLDRFGSNVKDCLTLMRMHPQDRTNDIIIMNTMAVCFGEKTIKSRLKITSRNPTMVTKESYRYAFLGEIYGVQTVNQLKKSATTLSPPKYIQPKQEQPSPQPQETIPEPVPTEIPPESGTQAEQSEPEQKKNPKISFEIPDAVQAMQDFGVEMTKIEGQILRPDSTIFWMGQMGAKKEGVVDTQEDIEQTNKHRDRARIFSELCKEQGWEITDGKYGSVKPTGWRETTYISVYIPSQKKAVLICNEYGNASFVIDSDVPLTEEEISTVMKTDLKELKGKTVEQVNFIAMHKNGAIFWRNSMQEAIERTAQQKSPEDGNAAKEGPVKKEKKDTNKEKIKRANRKPYFPDRLSDILPEYIDNDVSIRTVETQQKFYDILIKNFNHDNINDKENVIQFKIKYFLKNYEEGGPDAWMNILKIIYTPESIRKSMEPVIDDFITANRDTNLEGNEGKIAWKFASEEHRGMFYTAFMIREEYVLHENYILSLMERVYGNKIPVEHKEFIDKLSKIIKNKESQQREKEYIKKIKEIKEIPVSLLFQGAHKSKEGKEQFERVASFIGKLYYDLRGPNQLEISSIYQEYFGENYHTGLFDVAKLFMLEYTTRRQEKAIFHLLYPEKNYEVMQKQFVIDLLTLGFDSQEFTFTGIDKYKRIISFDIQGGKCSFAFDEITAILGLQNFDIQNVDKFINLIVVSLNLGDFTNAKKTYIEALKKQFTPDGILNKEYTLDGGLLTIDGFDFNINEIKKYFGFDPTKYDSFKVKKALYNELYGQGSFEILQKEYIEEFKKQFTLEALVNTRIKDDTEGNSLFLEINEHKYKRSDIQLYLGIQKIQNVKYKYNQKKVNILLCEKIYGEGSDAEVKEMYVYEKFQKNLLDNALKNRGKYSGRYGQGELKSHLGRLQSGVVTNLPENTYQLLHDAIEIEAKSMNKSFDTNISLDALNELTKLPDGISETTHYVLKRVLEWSNIPLGDLWKKPVSTIPNHPYSSE